MIQYRIPVRNNTLQDFSYTFKDENDNVIDLTGLVSASLELKREGLVYATYPASIKTPYGDGKVELLGVLIPSTGVWTAQFLCLDGVGNKLAGEPIRFVCVPNVEDLTLNQLPTY